MDGYLSFYNSIPIYVWATVSLISLVSTNVYPNYFIGSVDDVHRSACFGGFNQTAFPEGGLKVSSCYKDVILLCKQELW